MTAIDYLLASQAPDGSFQAWSCPDTENFREERRQPTAFQTSLIAASLQSVPAANVISDKAAAFIATQGRPSGAWNYWLPDSLAARQEPYPDDLDDTSCAVAVLSRHDPSLIDSGQLGAFARLLLTADQGTGGPYNTWLGGGSRWHDIDAAVNANIGYALAAHGVLPAGLRSYIDTVIKRGDYASSFYIGEIPTVYFLSRWYHGAARPQLATKIKALLADQTHGIAHTAMLVSAARYQSVDYSDAERLAERLALAAVDGACPPEPIYVDPAYDGRQYYGGSAALTTALVVEALHGVTSTSEQATQPVRREQLPITGLSRSFQRRYRQIASRVVRSPSGEQVARPASLMMQASGWHCPAAIVRSCNQANIDGWVAYTIYDDILDNEGNAADICLANIALRRSFGAFLAAYDDPGYKRLVRRTFDTMDTANDWEQRHARAPVSGRTVTIRRLPTYGDRSQLADRSAGHSLAALGVAYNRFGSTDAPEVLALQRFFTHFLIARQLNDDAHDWEDDLAAGQLSSVVCQLLGDAGLVRGSIELDSQLDALRRCFWDQTILTVCAQIDEHAAMARQALGEVPLKRSEILSAWLDDLQHAADAALAGRTDAKAFMRSFNEGLV